MDYENLAYLHLATVVPAAACGAAIFALRKGTSTHKLVGRTYVALMLTTTVIALFMPARVGPQFIGHFGYIHLLVLVTYVSLAMALYAIRHGKVRWHARAMTGLYVGAIGFAGALALSPGRFLHKALANFFFG